MNAFAYVGCRTSVWRGARGRGIEVFRIDDAGAWHPVQRIASSQENPSWLTLDEAHHRLYALHGDGESVAVFARDPENGRLTLLSEQTTGPRHPHPDLDPQRRNNPVHAVFTPDNRYLLIANHEGGNVAALPFDADRQLLPPEQLIRIAGHAPESAQPPSLSRPHEIVFARNSPFFALPLQGRQAGNGIDMIQLYRWHAGQATLCDEVRLPAGSWPRHVDFHPNGRWLYGLCERGNTVTLFDVDRQRGRLTLKQRLSSLPDGATTPSEASEIEVHPSGRFLYAANRGHDSIAVFHIHPADGTLTAAGWVPCGGTTPRFTTLSPDGRRFYSANETSDTICIFDVHPGTGMLQETGQVVAVASPTCLCFAGYSA